MEYRDSHFGAEDRNVSLSIECVILASSVRDRGSRTADDVALEI